MTNLNELPSETIRHDPWFKANMDGTVVHYSQTETDASPSEVFVENTDDTPVILAASFWGSAPYEVSAYYRAIFSTEIGSAHQYLINEFARAQQGEDTAYYVQAPLRMFTSGTRTGGTKAFTWSAAAGQRLTPFGPNGFTGAFIVMNGLEDMHFQIARLDGLTDSQDWNISLTWTPLDYSFISHGGDV